MTRLQPGTPPSVAHLVVTDNFAGVERYVTTVAAETARRGLAVTVLGGAAEHMRRLLPDDVRWRPAGTLREATRALLQVPADVVHVHMTKAEAVAGLFPRGHAIVATRHFASTRGRNRGVAIATGLIARRLSAEIAISETVRMASGVPEMRVLLNPVPLSSTPRRPERTVVVAQRWDREKRTHDAIDAFTQSGLAVHGWRLIIHGGGEQAAALRRRVAASRAAEAIDVAGFTEDMPRVLSRAGLVLATAEHEPFGLVVAEAMAAGAPVVASRSGGHLETVGQVGGALLYPSGDTRACAEVLRRAGELPESWREAYGARSRTWAGDHLGVAQHVDALLEIYGQATHRGQGPPFGSGEGRRTPRIR